MDLITVDFHPLHAVEDALYQYAVILSRYNGQWIFCMHRDRTTWEIPGGRREPQEAILDTAKRELYEETGAENYTLQPLSAYAVTKEGQKSYGLFCFAEIARLSPLPPSEISRIALFDALPSAMTYPQIQPVLFQKGLECLSKL